MINIINLRNKIFICKKEAKETLYWLELMGKSIDDQKLKEKARELLDRESRITMSAQDFHAFTLALNGTFTPNVALQNALNVAQKVRRA